MTQAASAPSRPEWQDIIDKLRAVEYRVHGPAQMAPDEGLLEVLELQRAIDELRQGLDRSFVGAAWLAVFASRPWLDRITVTASASLEYGDEGQCDRSFEVSVADLGLVAGAEAPEEAQLPDGTPDLVFLQDEIADEADEFECETYLCLQRWDDDTADHTRTLRRGSVNQLLASLPASGAEGFCVLFDRAQGEAVTGREGRSVPVM